MRCDAMRCDAMRCDATRRDATRRDATRRDATRRDATRRDATRRDATRRDATRRDATRRDATRRDDAARRGAARRGAARRGAARRGAARRGAARRGAARRGAARRGAARRGAARRDGLIPCHNLVSTLMRVTSLLVRRYSVFHARGYTCHHSWLVDINALGRVSARSPRAPVGWILYLLQGECGLRAKPVRCRLGCGPGIRGAGCGLGYVKTCGVGWGGPNDKVAGRVRAKFAYFP